MRNLQPTSMWVELVPSWSAEEGSLWTLTQILTMWLIFLIYTTGDAHPISFVPGVIHVQALVKQFPPPKRSHTEAGSTDVNSKPQPRLLIWIVNFIKWATLGFVGFHTYHIWLDQGRLPGAKASTHGLASIPAQSRYLLWHAAWQTWVSY